MTASWNVIMKKDHAFHGLSSFQDAHKSMQQQNEFYYVKFVLLVHFCEKPRPTTLKRKKDARLKWYKNQCSDSKNT